MKGHVPFPIHANGGIAMPRFATQEDAELFMHCLKYGDPYPPEKWIHPYRINGEGRAVINDAYSDARFELQYYYGPIPTLVDVK